MAVYRTTVHSLSGEQASWVVRCRDGASFGSHRCAAEIICGSAVASLTFYLSVTDGLKASHEGSDTMQLQSELHVLPESVCACACIFVCMCSHCSHHPCLQLHFAWLPSGWYGASPHHQFTEIARDELRLTGDELGSGAFGVAMKAYHIPTGQDVVVKTLKSGKATEAAVCRWMPCVMWY